MKAPSLQKTTALSAFLHLTLFLVVAFVLKQSNHMKLPSPYIVDLVSPSGRSVTARTHHAAGHHVSHERRTVKKSIPARQRAKKMKEAAMMREMVREKADNERIRDRIAELTALNKIKQLYKLREVISVPAKGQESDTKQPPGAEADGKGSGQTVGSYMDKITGEIWKQWSWDSSMGEKDLEAVISVQISKDGTITIQKIEKSSGNRFFDRSALMALKSASPVTPPPDRTDIEIGIRFFL